ncbi:MAG: class I SAM-dependent methyltransferase [Acidobacteriota bacterium]|nr:MAG: class I SAM-dependent methyltransferase [Acidobacteriota bacterium]
MPGYYTERLSAERLRGCYEIAPPRVRQYLDEEIRHAARAIRPTDCVLELGCGYGRILERLQDRTARLVGIDTSAASLRLAHEILGEHSGCRLLLMDASHLALCRASFDVVLCLQNGLSAFHVEPRAVIEEAVRVTRPSGSVLLSSYSERFWRHRLEWFRLQADRGLLGSIDEQATGGGVIVCTDGFRASTISPERFISLVSGLPVRWHLREIDGSSLFCELTVE